MSIPNVHQYRKARDLSRFYRKTREKAKGRDMRESSAEEIAFVYDEDLRFVLQLAK